MKKFLSIFLSISVLFFSINLNCYAKTSWNECIESSSQKSISVYKQDKGERLILQGEKLPNIVINNNAESKASAEASSSSGGSGLSKFILLAIKVAIGAIAVKKGLTILKNLGQGLSKNISEIVEFLKKLIIKNEITNNDSEKEKNHFGIINSLFCYLKEVASQMIKGAGMINCVSSF